MKEKVYFTVQEKQPMMARAQTLPEIQQTRERQKKTMILLRTASSEELSY